MWKPLGKGAAAGPALVIIALAVAGCSVKTVAAPPAPTNAAPAATPEVVTTSTPEPEPLGERDSPFPYGKTGTITSSNEDIWNIVVTEPRDRTKEILAENQFNERPPKGSAYYAIRSEIQWLGEEPIEPWLDYAYGLEVAFVTADGRTLEREYVVAPWKDLSDISDMYEGATEEFVTIVLGPDDLDGTVRVAIGGDFYAYWG